MLYSVFKLDDYATRRNSYIAISSVIFVMPLLAFFFLLLSPYPSVLEKKRTKLAKGSPCKLVVTFLAAMKAVN